MFIIAAFSIPIRKTFRKADLSYYSVNLVGERARRRAAKAVPAESAGRRPRRKRKRSRKSLLRRKAEARRKRAACYPTTKERSLAPKKKDVPLETTKDEVRSLDQRIREMRSRTQYMDVSGGKEAAAGRGRAFPAPPRAARGRSIRSCRSTMRMCGRGSRRAGIRPAFPSARAFLPSYRSR